MAGKNRRQRRHRQSLVSDSPFIRLQNEVTQNSRLRLGLIEVLEHRYDAKVVTLFTSFTRTSGGMISDSDAEMLESLLAVEQDKGKLILVLNSPGGQALAAERIVNVCRAYAGDSFEVMVPHMAKSAATMICLGASCIHMSTTAELGPVDPQVPYKDDKGNEHWISADEYVRSYHQLFSEAASGQTPRIEPHLQQLARYDARLVEQLKSAQSLSADISVRLLKVSMMTRKTDDEIRASMDVFLTQQKTSAHGRMITFDEAKSCGLNVVPIDLHSDVWNTLWELYVRSNYVVSAQCSKLMESSSSSVSA